MHHRQLLRRRPSIDPATSAVVTDPIAAIGRHGIVVDIGDNRDIYIRDRPIVPKPIMIPISAVIAAAGVSKAVVDAAVVANVRTPVT